MRKISFLMFLCCLLIQGRTQQTSRPLVLRGKLANCPETLLRIAFLDDNGGVLMDSIPVSPDGSFYFITNKCTRPQRTSIQQRRTQINDIYVAPGYDLNFNADASDWKTLVGSMQITGKGAAANQYRQKLVQWSVAHSPDTMWFQIRSETSFLDYVNTQRRVSDSIAAAVFTGNGGSDPYFSFFREMTFLDNQFMNLYYLVTHAHSGKLNSEERKNYVRQNFRGSVAKQFTDFDNLEKAPVSNEKYLGSAEFRNWILSDYTDFLLRLDYMKDSTLRNNKSYRLEKMSRVYGGKIKDFALFNQMDAEISYTKSIEKLNQLKERFAPFIEASSDDHKRKSLTAKIQEKERDLMRTAVGKPAPAFTLGSDKGSIHRLTDFAGKVVYLDLWASWCSPCREETPYLSALYQKYKNDNRIAFISVAVSDAETAWREALQKDQPGWLQLWDKENTVKNGYVANMIPQFVVINKKGEIVDFNAPRPSEKDLESLLLREMAL